MTEEGLPVMGTPLTQAFVGHMERQLHTIAGSDWRIRFQKGTHGMTALLFVFSLRLSSLWGFKGQELRTRFNIHYVNSHLG